MDLSASSFLSLPTSRYPFWPAGSSTREHQHARGPVPHPLEDAAALGGLLDGVPALLQGCAEAARESGVSLDDQDVGGHRRGPKGYHPPPPNFSSGTLPGISSSVGFRGGMGSIGRWRAGATTSGGRGGGAVSTPTSVRRSAASSMSETSSYTSPPERQLATLKPRTRAHPHLGPRGDGGDLSLGVLEHEQANPAVRSPLLGLGQLVDDVGRIVLAEVGQARSGDGRPRQVGKGDADLHLVAEPALDVVAAGVGELVGEPALVAERGVLEDLLPVAGPQLEATRMLAAGRHQGKGPPAGPGDHLDAPVLPADAGAEQRPERLRGGRPGPQLNAPAQRALERGLAGEPAPAAATRRRHGPRCAPRSVSSSSPSRYG